MVRNILFPGFGIVVLLISIRHILSARERRSNRFTPGRLVVFSLRLITVFLKENFFWWISCLNGRR